MKHILQINGVDFDGPARALNALTWTGWTRSVDDGDSLSFTVEQGPLVCAAATDSYTYPSGAGWATPSLPFPLGCPVKLYRTADDGSNRVIKFAGELPYAQAQPTDRGWAFRFACPGTRDMARRATLFSPDNSGVAAFNLDQQDIDYVATNAGKSVGQIVRLVLEGDRVRAGLVEAGVKYNGSSLPAQTITDLAALSIVPRVPIRLSGQGVLEILGELIATYHPAIAWWIEADGTLRFKDVFAFTARPVQLTSPTTPSPVDRWEDPEYDLDARSCFTAYEFEGLDVRGYLASKRLGSLVPAWDATDQNGGGASNKPAWTIDAFNSPGAGGDQGSVSGLTSTSATLTSDDSKKVFDAGYLATVEAVIYLLDTTLGAAGTFSEYRRVTVNTALAAGGTYTVNWSSQEPLNSTGYTKYVITAKNAPRALVGRLFSVVGLNYPMYTRFPTPIWFQHLSGKSQITTAAAFVQWSPTRDGTFPMYELPDSVELIPDQKQVVLAQPDVLLSADYQALTRGYPATQAQGLPYDVVALIPYNAGSLSARAPASGYQGTAFAKHNIQRTARVPVDTFTNPGDLPALQQLAAEKLKCYQDVVAVGSINCLEYPTTFDPMDLGQALQIPFGDLRGLNVPIRSATVEPNGRPGCLLPVSTRFSTLKRPFQGDDLFMHPAFGSGSFGLQSGYDDSVSAGVAGQFLGTADFNYGFRDTGQGQNFAVNTDPTTAMDGYRAGGRPSASQRQVDETARRSQADRAPKDDGMTRQESIDATARAQRDLRSPAEEAEKRRLAGEALARHAPAPDVVASATPDTADDLKAAARANNPRKPDEPTGIAGVDPPPYDDPTALGGGM